MARKPPPSELGTQTLRLLSLTHAQTVAPRVRELMQSGMTMKQVIATLDAEGIKTRRGGAWRPVTIWRVLDLTRCDALAPAAKEPAEPGPDDSGSDRPRRGRIGIS
jgi:uncharacterized protein YoaH (UPF0181 family)